MRLTVRSLAAAASAAALALSLTACGGGDDDPGEPRASASATESDGGSDGGSTDGSADGSDGSEGSAGPGAASTDGEPGEPGSTSAPQPADSDLCTALSGVLEVVAPIQGEPDEADWGRIQEAYAALGDADLPKGATARHRQGRDAAVGAITSLSWREAQEAFDDPSGRVPGLSDDDQAKASEFFAWSGQQCPSVLGTGDPEGSVTTQ
ncbi:hypothetical protein L615_001000000380 [Nocardioides sp. J9]|uniref:hypothetical protein n=1 Tax=Nocardioides sp. J9 TaxID=935844 RepID=UPI0011A77816|nr:hypothetical protein [Nocardioides sp. J9]TWH04705.1 hypothetical protein L615_001000000380 [Nocardioides sp. J9]